MKCFLPSHTPIIVIDSYKQYCARSPPTALLGMTVPLTCAVDYHGFRILAVAKMPISTPVFTSSGKLRRAREDMVHGTPDGGGTVLNENRILSSKLQTVAEKLNLSLHMAKVRQKRNG